LREAYLLTIFDLEVRRIYQKRMCASDVVLCIVL